MTELGVDVNAAAADGWTTLHFATGKIMVDVLVEAGANVEARSSASDSKPLQMTSRIETIRALVDHGADVKTQDKLGNTPLHSVVAVGRVYPEVVDFLLRSGADETIVNNNGKTALIRTHAHAFGECSGGQGMAPPTPLAPVRCSLPQGPTCTRGELQRYSGPRQVQ